MKRYVLPDRLYTSDQCRKLDEIAIGLLKADSFSLMEKAGASLYSQIKNHFLKIKKKLPVTVFCGSGNNGGDGFVVAALALQDNFSVKVVVLKDPENLKNDAQAAWKKFNQLGGEIELFHADLHIQYGVVVDALLGTGLEGEVSEVYQQAIKCINSSDSFVIAADIPSGLSADTGEICGCSVKADVTVTFIGLKRGMFTFEGMDCCGEIIFSSLDVPRETYLHTTDFVNHLTVADLKSFIVPRKASSHKGNHGYVTVIGGNEAMAGAVIMAAKAAYRSGAGLVRVLTHPSNVTAVHCTCPEIIVHGVENNDDLSGYFEYTNAIVLGPGLGRDSWADMLVKQVWHQSCPAVIDADALNILAQAGSEKSEWLKNKNVPTIITPHPKEAAKLLNSSTSEIQKNRFASVEALGREWNGVIILKGAGSLIYSEKQMSLCSLGNPGMAVAGMGDILTGIIGSLVAQGYNLEQAAKLGVWLHASAGDLCAEKRGIIGMMATDLFDFISYNMNQLAYDHFESVQSI